MKVYNIRRFGIIVSLDDVGGGTIVSDLKEPHEDQHGEEFDSLIQYNAAMDAIESMILAHACTGIDVATPAYIEGIETAVQSCGNEFS